MSYTLTRNIESTDEGNESSSTVSDVTTSLVVRVMDGSDGDWERLVQLYSPSIDMLMSRWHVPVSDREGLKNDVFAETFKGLSEFVGQNGSRSFLAWLWTIARRQVKRRAHAERRRPDRAVGGEWTTNAIAGVPQTPTTGDRADLLRRILAQLSLSDSESQLLKPYHLSGLPAIETGTRMGISEVAVRQRSARLLKKIREEVGDLETWLND